MVEFPFSRGTCTREEGLKQLVGAIGENIEDMRNRIELPVKQQQEIDQSVAELRKRLQDIDVDIWDPKVQYAVLLTVSAIDTAGAWYGVLGILQQLGIFMTAFYEFTRSGDPEDLPSLETGVDGASGSVDRGSGAEEPRYEEGKDEAE